MTATITMAKRRLTPGKPILDGKAIFDVDVTMILVLVYVSWFPISLAVKAALLIMVVKACWRQVKNAATLVMMNVGVVSSGH